jgi:hypothetical protein
MGTLLPLNQIDARPYCPEPFSEPDGMRDIHACLPTIDKRHPLPPVPQIPRANALWEGPGRRNTPY